MSITYTTNNVTTVSEKYKNEPIVFFYIDGELERLYNKTGEEIRNSSVYRISSSTIIPSDLLSQLYEKIDKKSIHHVENWKQKHSLLFYEWDHKDVFQGFLLVYLNV